MFVPNVSSSCELNSPLLLLLHGDKQFKAAFPLTRLNGGRNLSIGESKRAGDVVTLFQTVPGTCRPIHEVQFSRNAVITGHSTINVGQHLHAEIGLSNASDIH